MLEMSKKLRVLVLMHPDLIPPGERAGLSAAQMAEVKTERDVCDALASLGHTVLPLGVGQHLAPLREAIAHQAPDIAFNLLAEFQGVASRDQGVVSYLELMGVPYTGCNPRGLLLARDKGLAKQLLSHHDVRSPAFEVFPMGRKARPPRQLSYPVIVKSLAEEASLGLSQSSVVTNDEKFLERVRFMHESIGTDAIAEEYVEGREITLSLLGDERLTTFPPWELDISGLPQKAQRIATYKVKWDLDYQARHGVKLRRAEHISEHLEAHIKAVSKRIYRALRLTGYGRIDFRLTADQKLYFLEANPNPDIAADDDFALSAEGAGVDYQTLIQKILNLGLRSGMRLRQAMFATIAGVLFVAWATVSSTWYAGAVWGFPLHAMMVGVCGTLVVLVAGLLSVVIQR